ncbi:MAG: metal ABC transporter ATP-binding protein [Spirochaetota bacterium]
MGPIGAVEKQNRSGRSDYGASQHDVSVEARSVYASYDSSYVLVDVSFSLSSGELIAIVGPNGAGKSTLFKLLTGIKRPDHGTLSVFGESVYASRRSNRIAYVPQETDIDWDFPITVRDVVLSGRFGRMRQEGGLRKFMPPYFARHEHHERVEEAIEAVDMASFASRPIGALSGGQKKRVFLARAIAQDADLLLLDEPLAGIDRLTETLFFDVLSRVRASGKTVLMISHDFPTVEKKADTVLLISRSVIDIGPAATTLTQDCLERAYHSVRRGGQ